LIPQKTLENLIFAWRPASVTRWPAKVPVPPNKRLKLAAPGL